MKVSPEVAIANEFLKHIPKFKIKRTGKTRVLPSKIEVMRADAALSGVSVDEYKRLKEMTKNLKPKARASTVNVFFSQKKVMDKVKVFIFKNPFWANNL